MMGSADPDARYDELFEPLALALGHLVFAAGLLEKTMLADLIQRKVDRDGAKDVFGRGLIADLERLPAGALLKALRKFGYAPELAGRIAVVIDSRNGFVHHLFEDAEFIAVFASRSGVERIVARWSP